MVSAADLYTYLSTNWTVSPPGTFTTTKSLNLSDTLLITDAPRQDRAIAAGLREITNTIKMRLSHSATSGITSLTTWLRAYSGGQHKLEIEITPRDQDLLGYYVWEIIVREKYRD